MTRVDALAAVVELACLTEDRTDAEQAALLDVAWRVDDERFRQRSNNPNFDSDAGCYVNLHPDGHSLTRLALNTRSRDTKVTATLAKRLAKLDRWAAA